MQTVWVCFFQPIALITVEPADKISFVYNTCKRGYWLEEAHPNRLHDNAAFIFKSNGNTKKKEKKVLFPKDLSWELAEWIYNGFQIQ